MYKLEKKWLLSWYVNSLYAEDFLILFDGIEIERSSVMLFTTPV